MMKELIINSVLIPSLKKLYSEDYENIYFGVSERNICARLALYMENMIRQYDETRGDFDFRSYHVDVEYDRIGLGYAKRYSVNPQEPRRMVSDILLHQRCGGQNLLALEMKKEGNKSGVESDKRRLMAMVSSPKPEERVANCVYDTSLGVFLVFSKEGIKMELYENRAGAGVQTDVISYDYDLQHATLLMRP